MRDGCACYFCDAAAGGPICDVSAAFAWADVGARGGRRRFRGGIADRHGLAGRWPSYGAGGGGRGLGAVVLGPLPRCALCLFICVPAVSPVAFLFCASGGAGFFFQRTLFAEVRRNFVSYLFGNVRFSRDCHGCGGGGSDTGTYGFPYQFLHRICAALFCQRLQHRDFLWIDLVFLSYQP